MNRGFVKVTAFYTAGIIAALWLMWSLLSIALPEANLNIIRALSTAFGINLPDDIFVSTSAGMRAVAVIVIISALSIGLIILNVFFGAIITTHFIRPRVAIATSSRGVLSEKWNAAQPYILVRLCSFHQYELADVRLSVVLCVREMRDDGEEVLCYLPVQDFTPPRILIMGSRVPWTIAVPGDALLSNSMTRNYHFNPGAPIVKSFSAGKKAVRVERSLDILIQGLDAHSYSGFVVHRQVPVDTQEGDAYTLHLHRGTFKSLPMRVEDKAELEQYAD